MTLDIQLAPPPPAGEWRSKTSWRGIAHFFTEAGEPVCGDRKGPHGAAMRDLFKTEWGPYQERDHLCSLCRNIKPQRCVCGRCTANGQVTPR